MSVQSGNSSLLSESITEVTSYDIPLQRRPHGHSHNPYEDLPSIETTTFTNDGFQNDLEFSTTNPMFNHSEDESKISHGFFLGKESLQDLALPHNGGENPSDYLEEDDEDTEDEGISEIYKPNEDPNSWIRRSDRSFKHSPEPTPRHALSKRIGNVGIIGQNIALGHRLGVLTEDASLIPKRVKLNSTQFTITEDSPVQIEITWTKPANSSSFSSLIYQVEVCLSDDLDLEDWTQLTDVRWPVLRVYHTDDKLFVGKLRVSRCKKDALIKLRVRSRGELVLPDRTRHWTVSAHSDVVLVTFAGYDYSPAACDDVEVQQTHL